MLSIVTRWEEDHVIARAKRHELQTPEHHDGAEAKWAKSIHHVGFSLARKRRVTCRRPLPGAPTVGVWTRGPDTNE